MRPDNRLWATILVLVIGLQIGALRGWAEQGRSVLDRSPPLVSGHSVTLQSSILGEARQLLIFLPDGHQDSNQPMPVIYLLDGWAHFRLTTATVELLAKNARMPRTMVVGITNTDRSRDFTTVAVEGLSTGHANRFLDFLEKEVIPFVEGNFSTAPHRTLIGHSLGGLLVMNVLADRPDLFDAAIAISPAVTNDERVGDGFRPLSERLTVSFADRPDLRFSLFVTMSDGEDGRWVSDFKVIERVLKNSAPSGLTWVFRRMEGEDHGTTVLPSTDQGLRFINSDWDTSGLVREGTLDDLVTRFDDLSDRLGTGLRPPEVMVNLLGYRFLGEERIEEAVEVFEYNVSLYPTSGNVHDSLGEALERGGKLPGAMRAYRRAVARAEADGDPRLPIFRANLVRVEGRLNADSASRSPELGSGSELSDDGQ